MTYSDPAKPDSAKKKLAYLCSYTELNRTTSTPNSFCLLDHVHFLWELRGLEYIILIQKLQCISETKKNTQGHGQDETVLVLGPFKKLVKSSLSIKKSEIYLHSEEKQCFLVKIFGGKKSSGQNDFSFCFSKELPQQDQPSELAFKNHYDTFF